MMMQFEMYERGERRNATFPNYVSRRVLDFVRLVDRRVSGEFYFRLTRLVGDYSLYMTGV